VAVWLRTSTSTSTRARANQNQRTQRTRTALGFGIWAVGVGRGTWDWGLGIGVWGCWAHTSERRDTRHTQRPRPRFAVGVYQVLGFINLLRFVTRSCSLLAALGSGVWDLGRLRCVCVLLASGVPKRPQQAPPRGGGRNPRPVARKCLGPVCCIRQQFANTPPPASSRSGLPFWTAVAATTPLAFSGGQAPLTMGRA
jgi:hypothetical protein